MSAKSSSETTAFRAYEYAEFGDPLQVIKLNTRAVTVPLKPSQVRVRVHAASLNPIDLKLVQFGAAMLPIEPSAAAPFRIGFDFAGVIDAVGSNVKGFNTGDEVFGGHHDPYQMSCADFINVEATALVRKPTTISFEEAAAIPLVGITSYQALLERSKLKSGDRVLVLGGSTATGMIGIQIAKAFGAHVIATTSTRNIELVRSLGADQVVDYSVDKWADVVDPQSMDIIYDCGVEPNAWVNGAQRVLKAGGTFVTIGRPDKAFTESPIGSNAVSFHAALRTGDLEAIVKLVEDGKIKAVIDSVHKFENLSEALKIQLSRRARGKIILQVADVDP